MDRHDTWNNRHCDALCFAFLDPTEKIVHIIEHLRHHESASGVNLLFQVLDQKICISIIITALRISSNTNIEMIPVSAFDVFDKIFGILKSSFLRQSRLPVLLVDLLARQECLCSQLCMLVQELDQPFLSPCRCTSDACMSQGRTGTVRR